MANTHTGEMISINQTFASNGTFVVPAGYMISDSPIIRNTTGNAVTGGVIIGTTNGGVDVLAALAVGASTLFQITDALLLKRAFSKTVDTTLYLQAVVAWNSASLNVTFFMLPYF